MRQLYLTNKFKIIIFHSALMTTLLFSQNAHSQTLNQTQAISFGTFVLHDFSNVAQITIHPNGTYSNNSYVYIMTTPQRGIFDTASQPATTAYTVSVSPTSKTITLGGITFTVDNFTTGPGSLITDGAGEDTFYLGARLQSQGGGVTYTDGIYSGNVNVTVNF